MGTVTCCNQSNTASSELSVPRINVLDYENTSP